MQRSPRDGSEDATRDAAERRIGRLGSNTSLLLGRFNGCDNVGAESQGGETGARRGRHASGGRRSTFRLTWTAFNALGVWSQLFDRLLLVPQFCHRRLQ